MKLLHYISFALQITIFGIGVSLVLIESIIFGGFICVFSALTAFLIRKSLKQEIKLRDDLNTNYKLEIK